VSRLFRRVRISLVTNAPEDILDKLTYTVTESPSCSASRAPAHTNAYAVAKSHRCASAVA